MAWDDDVRTHVLNLLSMEGAHIGLERATADMPADAMGRRPDRVPYSPWQLLEHMRLAQEDILEFSRDPDYESPEWPEGYWPSDPAPPNSDAWRRSVNRWIADNRALKDLVANPETDLLAEIAHGQGQTVLREALVAADHNAYHTGQLIVVRRMLDAWPDD